MTKEDWYREIPEWYFADHGDPFVAEIVKADDIIDDHTYNTDWVGLSDAEAARVVAWATKARLSYELETLYRWWSR